MRAEWTLAEPSMMGNVVVALKTSISSQINWAVDIFTENLICLRRGSLMTDVSLHGWCFLQHVESFIS